MKDVTYKPIGIIHSPFKDPRNTPIQPSAAKKVKGTIEIFPEYVAGLKDLDGFSHIILLYHFHLVKSFRLEVQPFLDDIKRGIFATRAPVRPNSIGLSIVNLLKVEKNILSIQDMDMVDGTPLLDIKPHVMDFYEAHEVKIGWLEKRRGDIKNGRADGRFIE